MVSSPKPARDAVAGIVFVNGRLPPVLSRKPVQFGQLPVMPLAAVDPAASRLAAAAGLPPFPRVAPQLVGNQQQSVDRPRRDWYRRCGRPGFARYFDAVIGFRPPSPPS